MKKTFTMLGAMSLAVLLLLGSAMQANAEVTEKTNQIWYRMHFGLGVGSSSITPEAIRIFVENEVAQRFPNGFNVEARVQGQWLSKQGLIRENNFIVNIITDNTTDTAEKVKQIAEIFADRFGKAKASVYVVPIKVENTQHYF